MIHIKNKLSIQKMAQSGHLLSVMFDSLADIMRPGISTAEVDAWIEKQLQEKKLTSRTKGYHGYQHASCISINDEVVHGVPRSDRFLQIGDLVKVDVCASLNGYCADMARSFFIGESSDNAKKLVYVAKQALKKGIEKACVGNRLSDISAAIQEEVEKHGFGVVRDFAGHGIGKQMHEDPEVLNYGTSGKGPILREGMTLAIEPMITSGGYDVYIDDDGWTVKTVDSSLAAHVEDTIAITSDGPIILTHKNSEQLKNVGI
jgi:methionyl aminopeptidase